ncbi:MAG TPA: divalent-cation tolerance protein CutA [Casimicrobiaceae bacterium]|nr:divalent-cation tolerance protein CutA [Casimicrobiaceae bacterium]
MSHILVLTTLPDQKSARDVAAALIEAKLAACVNIGSHAVISMYHWHEAIETADEVPLTIKTRADLFDDVAEEIRARHPYELPEIIAVPITHGTSDYLAWLDAETQRR